MKKVILLVLIIGLVAGVILVKRQQDVRSKAAGTCDMRWPADPATACGKTTQSPAQDATVANLTPDFHWDYGGYRAGETGCVQPSGCGNYSAVVYLAEGSTYSESAIMASCGLGTSSTPPKDAPFSCFRTWRDGPQLTALKPSTSYSWVVTPFFDGVVHAEQTWTYHFKTPAAAATHMECEGPVCVKVPGAGADLCDTTNAKCVNKIINQHLVCQNNACVKVNCPGDTACADTCKNDTECVPPPPPPPPIPVGVCQKVISSKDLSTIKIGDTVTFTGFGNLTNPAADDSIDKIEFTVLKDSGQVLKQVVDTTEDASQKTATQKFWKATQDFKIDTAGTYSVQIKAHWKSKDQWLL